MAISFGPKLPKRPERQPTGPPTGMMSPKGGDMPSKGRMMSDKGSLSSDNGDIWAELRKAGPPPDETLAHESAEPSEAGETDETTEPGGPTLFHKFSPEGAHYNDTREKNCSICEYNTGTECNIVDSVDLSEGAEAKYCPKFYKEGMDNPAYAESVAEEVPSETSEPKESPALVAA